MRPIHRAAILFRQVDAAPASCQQEAILTDESNRWREWLQRHGAALVLFARQWSASSADTDDAVQNGFLKFWKTRARARDEVAYLYACVRSAAMDLGRGERRRSTHERHASEPERSMFELSPERAERDAAIEAALNQLPGDQREVIVMKIWGELTFAQIGDALAISPSTAASRYRYAIARLEIELSEKVSHD
jgi:RNA polymerase sigma-70 factor (ECF subfamily)